MMQGEQLKGRTSRASSTSSLGREVRCGCQYYQSDSLLPERQARIGRPSSRTGGMQELPASRLPCSEHEYELIAAPLGHHPLTTAPVVQIIDTDVVPVADSDDSIDERGLLPSKLILGGDVILPLDGRIEDVAMEGQELGETIGDTSEEQDSPQQLQERLDERYFSSPSSPVSSPVSSPIASPIASPVASPVVAPPSPPTATTTPGAESRTDGEVNTNQMDSPALDELPLRRDSRTIPQRLKSQADKLGSRLRGIQRPNFSFAKRPKSEKTRSTATTGSGKSDKSRTDKKAPSRMDRIRSSFSERPRFSLPDRPKFNFPDRSKLRLPDKSKFRLPEKAKFSMKRPNISLPKALKRKTRKSSSKEQQQQQQRSTDSTIGGSRRNIFDFSTYPRIFEKKSKTRGHVEDVDVEDYAATSSPKDSRAQSQESATFPRVRKTYPSTTASWARRFGEPTFDELDQDENVSAIDRMRPWRHPSLEEPRRSLMLEEKDTLAARISWEKSQKKEKPRKSGQGMEEEVEEEEEEEIEEEEIQYMDYDPDSVEISEGREINVKEKRRETEQPREPDWRQSDEEAAVIGGEIFKPVRRARSLTDPTAPFEVGTSFAAVDPRQFEQIQLSSKEEKKDEDAEVEEVEEIEIEEEGYEEEELEEELEELEERDLSSAHSDREQQQSSGSSCDRRRRGIVEDTGSEEYYPRDNVTEFDKYFEPVNALADDIIMPSIPPKRPARRSLRKRKEEDSIESYDVVVPPARAKRERMVQRTSEDISDDLYYEERSDSSSRHRVVYQAEFDPTELTKQSTNEPLDDIVVVKPARRKSRSSLRSQSQVPIESDIVSRNIIQNGDVPRQPPVVPTRRKRARGLKIIPNGKNEQLFPTTMCNGRSDKWEESLLSSSRMGIEPIRSQEIHDIMLNSQEDKVLVKHREHADTPIPVPPKRRSRSRTISLAQDDDRTSHGAESLPDVDYIQEDIPRDEIVQDSMRDLSGYALVDKREKPPRPPPPRRRKIREKFSTTPRPSPPKRPQRTYSTLTSSTKLRDDLSMDERIMEQRQKSESMPYIEIDLEDRKELRDDRVLSKIQGRPLPAPPRPPRARKDHSQDRYDESLSEIINEATTATQTDPLPDDMIIEEEITQAKLIVTPSLSGSQVMVSTERIPSPSHFQTLPGSEFSPNDDDDKYRHVDTPRSSREPSPYVDYHERFQERRSSPTRTPFSAEPPPPFSGEPPPPSTIHETIAIDQADLQSRLQSIIRSALMTDETLRISSLEVADLKVDRLSVSQLETSKLLASEIDAIVISASELKNLQEPKEEDSFSPAIIKELIAIRSHLENVASSQAREERRLRDRESDTESTLKESIKKDVIQDQKEIKTYDDKVSITDRSVKSSSDDEKDIKDTKNKIKIESTETESFVESMADIETIDPMSMKRLETFESKQQLSTQIRHSDSKSSLTAEFDLMSERRPEIDVVDVQDKQVQSKKEDDTTISRKSRSRSSSPTTERTRPVRQTASPIRSLPPVISVTPDTPDTTSSSSPYNISNVTQAQHAVISYSEDPERSSDNQEAPRECSQSPIMSTNLSTGVTTHFIAFPTSQIPEEFLSLVSRSPSTSARVVEPELSIRESSRQLLRAIRIVGAKLIRDFASHLISRFGADDPAAAGKIRELELALCALLLVIAILLMVYFSNSRTIMHYHHWDYFNPPQ